jgi:hypothetical protein
MYPFYLVTIRNAIIFIRLATLVTPPLSAAGISRDRTGCIINRKIKEITPFINKVRYLIIFPPLIFETYLHLNYLFLTR